MVALPFDYTGCRPEGQRVVCKRGIGTDVECKDTQPQHRYTILWSPHGLCKGRVGIAIPEIKANDPLEYIKSPVIAEFLGFRKDTKYDESLLEQALIDHLQQFIMELGRGFAFVDRQKHIATGSEDFYIDLVFYNIKLKRYVLFELKTHPLTHADVGQLDMYVRMYDDLVRDENDNPTIGILLCTETDKVMAKYSVLNGSEQLFAAKYMAYMPTEEELSREIEQQKRFFLEQHGMEE